MQILFRRALVAGAVVLLAACANAPVRPTLAEVGIYSAGTGSAFLPYAQGVAAHLAAAGLKAAAIESSGSIENARKVNAEPQRLGTVFLGTAHEAFTGTGAWTQGARHSNLRALFPMYETAFQFAALRASNLRDLRSLAGKRVGVGPSGGPAEAYFKGLVETLGLPVRTVNGTPAAMTADLLAGRVEAIFQGASVPVPSIKQAADQADILVFGLDDAALAAMRSRFPYLTPTVVPGGTYRGNDAASQTVSAWNFVLAHKDLPEADAYWITRTVLSVPDPRALHPSAGPTRASNAPRNQAVPFHPGALRYYGEQGISGLK